MTRAPNSTGSAIALAAITIYRVVISPILTTSMGPACRFEPSCSEYANAAITRHGVMRGGWMAVKRLLRCRPGGGWGYDPVVDERVAADQPSPVARGLAPTSPNFERSAQTPPPPLLVPLRSTSGSGRGAFGRTKRVNGIIG